MPSDKLGTCCICSNTFKLVANGLVTRHGGKKKGNECAGSMTLPSATISISQPSSAPAIPVLKNNFTFDITKPSNIYNASLKNNLKNKDIRLTQLTSYLNNNKHITTCKFIPKAARVSVRLKLISLISAVTADVYDLDAWIRLFSFPLSVLYVESKNKLKNGQITNKNLTNSIKSRIETFIGVESLPNIATREFSKNKNPSALTKCVKGKMEQGNIKAAVRLLAEDNCLAPVNENTIASLREKHPTAITPTDLPLAADNSLVVNATDVILAIRSFPAGSAGGLDGLRPQHLKDLLTRSSESDELVETLTKFLNVLYKGVVCPEIKNILFGGNITALIKKTGDIRPITVGCVFRRLASKCANRFAIKKLETLFAPKQLGVGIKGGAEAAIHSARIYLNSLNKNQAFIKLDFKNAFNCLDRKSMLLKVFDQLNELYNYCRLNYLEPINLNYQGVNVTSSCGVQQGDPLGPLLFALTIHSLLTEPKSELIVGYLDDISLGDDVNTLAEDFLLLKETAKKYGLTLNEDKCEFISADPANRPACFRNFVALNIDEAELLGSAIIKGVAQTHILSKKYQALQKISKKLSLIDSHDALLILRYCLSTPRIIYVLRSTPCCGHPLLEQIDSLLKSSLSEIINVKLEEKTWLQASLPIRAGGLGLRSATSLAEPAFIASVFSTRILSLSILPLRLHETQDLDFNEYLSMWSNKYGLYPNPDKFSHQKTWDSTFVEASYNYLLSDANNLTDRARLRAIHAPYAGAWLQALPLSSCGLRLSNSEIRVSAALRLGARICHQHKCICGAIVEDNGIHGLSCRRSAGRHPRHSRLNEIIDKTFLSLNIPCIREPLGLSGTESLRPDGVTVIPWKQGKCLAWDVTVPDTLAPSHIKATSEVLGSAATIAASNKNIKYNSLLNNYWFEPVSVETLGVFDSNSLNFLKTLGSKLIEKTKDPMEMQYLMQKISCAIQKGNYVSIIGTYPSIVDAHTFSTTFGIQLLNKRARGNAACN